MKLYSSFKLRQPVLVSFVRGVVIKHNMDLFVRGLIGQHAIEETAKILPLLILRKFRLHLASADFKGGKQIQCNGSLYLPRQRADSVMITSPARSVRIGT